MIRPCHLMPGFWDWVAWVAREAMEELLQEAPRFPAMMVCLKPASDTRIERVG